MSQEEGTRRVREWLDQTWPDAEIIDVDVSTGRDSLAWDIYRRGAKPFRIEATGQLRAQADLLEERLIEATERKVEIEATAPGTTILASDGIERRTGKA